MSNVLITGANKGIGLSLCTHFAEAGYTVIGCTREMSRAGELKKLKNTRIAQLDVSNDESVKNLKSSLEGIPIDVLINNAGIMGPDISRQGTLQMDFEGWMEVLNVNTLGPVRVMQALLPNLKLGSNAKLITISSTMGALSNNSLPFAHAYSSSKAAINKFMRLAQPELNNQGITSALIHPGWVRTDMGGKEAAISPEESAKGCIDIIHNLSAINSGKFWSWDGNVHEW